VSCVSVVHVRVVVVRGSDLFMPMAVTVGLLPPVRRIVLASVVFVVNVLVRMNQRFMNLEMYVALR
jgi:hypothetical protein